MKVKDLMSKEVLTVEAEENIDEAGKKLREYKISGAPVVEEGKVVGVLSEEDLLKALEEKEISFFTILPSPFEIIELPIRVRLGLDEAIKRAREVAEMKVRDVMSKGAVTISPEENISEAARVIRERNINRLPVVEEGELVGIITRADLLQAL